LPIEKMDPEASGLLPAIPEEDVSPAADSVGAGETTDSVPAFRPLPQDNGFPESLKLEHGDASFNVGESSLTLKHHKGEIVLNAIAVGNLGRFIFEGEQAFGNLVDCSQMKNATVWSKDLRVAVGQRLALEIRVYNHKPYFYVCSYFQVAPGGNSDASQSEIAQNDSRLATFLEAMNSANQKPTWYCNSPYWLDPKDVEPLMEYVVRGLKAKPQN